MARTRRCMNSRHARLRWCPEPVDGRVTPRSAGPASARVVLRSLRTVCLTAWTSATYRRGLRIMAGLLALACLTATARAQEQEQRAHEQEETQPPRSHSQQRADYLYSTFGPPGLIESFLTGTLQQLRNVPSEW